MHGRKKTMKTMKRRWVPYALPEGFAEREYPKDSNYHTTSRSTMGHKSLGYGYQTIFKQCKYWEEQERHQCKVYNSTSLAQHGPG
jgi:hypothetical protein